MSCDMMKAVGKGLVAGDYKPLKSNSSGTHLLWTILLPVLLRGHAVGLFEDTGKIAPVDKPRLRGNV